MILHAFLGLVFIYFTFHLFLGERSILSAHNLAKEYAQSQVVLADLQAQKNTIYDTVIRLRPSTLDRDVVEEQVMMMLGRTGNNAVLLSE